jgi:ribosomal protein S18 acetylase RimI-like enzyme
MTKITIRKMRKDDLPVVSDLAMLANPHATKEKYVKLLAGLLKVNPDLSFVATDSEKVIGYAQAEMRGNDQAILEDIAVREEHQRRRVGTQLLARTVKALERKGARMVFAEVHYKCAAAIPFYYRHGFRISGFGQDYFGISHDAIVLKLMLDR